MPRLPFMQFYPRDFIEATRGLSADAKATWIDIICYSHMNEAQRGTVRGTLAEIARRVGLSEERADAALREIQSQKVADLRRKRQVIFIRVRRHVREEKKRKAARDRQKRVRVSRASHAPVTDRYQIPDTRGQNVIDGAGAPGLLSPHAELAGGLRAAELSEHIPRAGRMLNKDNGDPRTVLAAVLQAQRYAEGPGMMGYAYQILKGDGPADEWLDAAKRLIAEGCA